MSKITFSCNPNSLGLWGWFALAAFTIVLAYHIILVGLGVAALHCFGVIEVTADDL